MGISRETHQEPSHQLSAMLATALHGSHRAADVAEICLADLVTGDSLVYKHCHRKLAAHQSESSEREQQ